MGVHHVVEHRVQLESPREPAREADTLTSTYMSRKVPDIFLLENFHIAMCALIHGRVPFSTLQQQ